MIVGIGGGEQLNVGQTFLSANGCDTENGRQECLPLGASVED
jgi:hypothetical protein